MNSKHFLKAGGLLILVLPLMLAGCEGDQGPAGPAGADGEDGQDAYASEFTYIGEAGTPCTHCHVNAVDQVGMTGHAHAMASLTGENATNPYCLQCHTTGWDRHVTYGSDDWMTADNPDSNGYDDYFGVEGDDAAARRGVLENVQCESCHGPMGPDFNDHTPVVNFATIGTHDPANVTAEDIDSHCYPCHVTQFEGPDGDFTGGYATSGHASAAGGDLDAFNAEHYATSGSCQPCHVSEGFIAANDPALTNYEFGSTVNFVGCVTCHDPHMGEGGDGHAAQVRNVGDVFVSYTFPYAPGDAEVFHMTGKETGQLCAQCHHARRDTDNVQSQIAVGYGHFGPHHSAQMDLFIGGGSYEIPGVDYDRAREHTHNQSIAKACVDCHMVRETMLHGELQDHAFHNFVPDLGTNCSGCHPGIDEAFVTTFQGTIEALMNDLATRFGYADYHDMEANWDSTDPGVTVWQREAAYAMYFLIGDGSLGVHNPNYAAALMNEAITYFDANTP